MQYLRYNTRCFFNQIFYLGEELSVRKSYSHSVFCTVSRQKLNQRCTKTDFQTKIDLLNGRPNCAVAFRLIDRTGLQYVWVVLLRIVKDWSPPVILWMLSPRISTIPNTLISLLVAYLFNVVNQLFPLYHLCNSYFESFYV